MAGVIRGADNPLWALSKRSAISHDYRDTL